MSREFTVSPQMEALDWGILKQGYLQSSGRSSADIFWVFCP